MKFHTDKHAMILEEKKKKQTAKTFNMMAFKLAITALEQDCYYTRCFHENVTSMCIAVLKNAN